MNSHLLTSPQLYKRKEKWEQIGVCSYLPGFREGVGHCNANLSALSSVCGRKFNYQLCSHETSRCSARYAGRHRLRQKDWKTFIFTTGLSLLPSHEGESVTALSEGTTRVVSQSPSSPILQFTKCRTEFSLSTDKTASLKRPVSCGECETVVLCMYKF